MSDCEQQAGNTWEAAMFSGKYKLNNLIGLIDRNNIQIDGMTEDIMPLEPLRAKYEAFNWHVLEIDGHNFEEIVNAVEEAKAIYEKPTVIISHNIPGKGIKEIELKVDSELIGRQLLGKYKIKDPDLQPLFIKAWNLRLDYDKVDIKIIPREQNKKADKLVNRELDSKSKLL